MRIVMFELSDNEGGSTHRFSVQDENGEYDNNKTIERIKREWLKDHKGVEIRNSGYTNVSGIIEGWGYQVQVTKAPKRKEAIKTLDDFFSKVTI